MFINIHMIHIYMTKVKAIFSYDCRGLWIFQSAVSIESCCGSTFPVAYGTVVTMVDSFMRIFAPLSHFHQIFGALELAGFCAFPDCVFPFSTYIHPHIQIHMMVRTNTGKFHGKRK